MWKYYVIATSYSSPLHLPILLENMCFGKDAKSKQHTRDKPFLPQHKLDFDHMY